MTRCTVATGDLQRAVRLCGPASPGKTTAPIYQNFKLIVRRDEVDVIATDLEVGIRHTIPASDGEPGEILLPVKQLGESIREAESETTTIVETQTGVEVSSGFACWDLPTEYPGTFAAFPDFPAPTLRFARADLARAIHRTVWSAAKDEGRYAMRGVLFEVSAKSVDVCATNGKTVALVTIQAEPIDAPEDKQRQTRRLLPPKSMDLVLSTLSESDSSSVEFVATGSQAFFLTHRTAIYTRLVEGRFPPIRDVFPKRANTTFVVAAEAMLAAIRQAKVTALEGAIEYDVGTETVGLRSKSDKGKAASRCTVSEPSGKPLKVTLGSEYFVPMLSALKSCRLKVGIVDGSKPVLVEASPAERFLIVPITEVATHGGTN